MTAVSAGKPALPIHLNRFQEMYLPVLAWILLTSCNSSWSMASVPSLLFLAEAEWLAIDG
jgi:hypothetical protein